jgi:phenylacetate-CoA ligase
VKAFKTIYERSPRFLRSVYLNAYGLNNISRLRKWERLLDRIEYTERLERKEQIELVENRLKGILRHAIERVPYYSKYTSLAGDLDSSSVFDVLKELPVIDKETIIRDPAAFVANGSGAFVISKTSGTTGTPLSVRMEKDTFLLTDALWWRRTRWTGYKDGDWIARLVGDPVIPLRIRDPKKPWMISRTDRRIYLSTFHLSQDTAIRMGELLNRKKPAFIMGYPSSLEILCNYLDESGFRMEWSPKAVLFSSEPMYDHQEGVIRKVIGSQIRGLYGSGERMVSAAQCRHGTYHLSLVDGFVEGQFGIMENIRPAAVTALTNRIMPLIRYQLGDVIETQPGFSCECGRTLPVMSPVITKDEDWLITPSGRKISPSAVVWAFIHQEIDGVTNGQVVQHDRESVTVYLNTSEDNYIRYKDILQESMEKVFFGEMKVAIVRTDRIDINRAGKSRFIVNELRQRK